MRTITREVPINLALRIAVLINGVLLSLVFVNDFFVVPGRKNAWTISMFAVLVALLVLMILNFRKRAILREETLIINFTLGTVCIFCDLFMFGLME